MPEITIAIDRHYYLMRRARQVRPAVRGSWQVIYGWNPCCERAWHGLFVVGKDPDSAFNLTDRIDTNAYCVLIRRLLLGAAYEPGKHANYTVLNTTQTARVG